MFTGNIAGIYPELADTFGSCVTISSVPVLPCIRSVGTETGMLYTETEDWKEQCLMFYDDCTKSVGEIDGYTYTETNEWMQSCNIFRSYCHDTIGTENGIMYIEDNRWGEGCKIFYNPPT